MKMTANRVKIIVALITTIGTIVVAYFSYRPTNNESRVLNKESLYVIAGTVINEDNNESIGQARIDLIGRNEFGFTEGNGNFRILLRDPLHTVRIRVVKQGYNVFDKSFNIPDTSIIIPLQK